MALDQIKVDDAFDDAKAAYAEVAAKAEPIATPADTSSDRGESPAPETRSARAPVKDERGRFTSKRTQEPEKTPASEETAPEGDQGAEEETEAPEPLETPAKPATGAVSPPTSWTVKSKAAWDALPEHVRADIAKRETEVSQGFAELRDYKDLKPFAEMAAKHNTTIAAALKHYTGIENVLRRDISAGLATIVQNYGLDQRQAAQLFAGLAQKYGGSVAQNGTPAPAGNPNGQMSPSDPLYNILKPFIEPLKAEITSLRQTHTSREAADRNAAEQSLARAIETFSSKPENRYYADLEETITRLFESGMVALTGNHEGDLRTAYDLAAQMNPDVREALIEQRLQAQKDAVRKQEQAAADKAKQASRSLTGSRIPGATVKSAQNSNGHDDIEADVRAAYRLHSQH